jgi:hypothetical protein
MTTEQTPEEYLVEAERQIAEAEAWRADQQALIEHLAAEGQETHHAERVLHALEKVLQSLYHHRQLILDAIADKPS